LAAKGFPQLLRKLQPYSQAMPGHKDLTSASMSNASSVLAPPSHLLLIPLPSKRTTFGSVPAGICRLDSKSVGYWLDRDAGKPTVSSYGPENQADQALNVAEFGRVVAEQSSQDLYKKPTSTTQGPLPSGSGAITGVVTDPSGAVVANVTVTLLFQNGQTETTTKGTLHNASGH
jgi:hypothetical protein